MKTLNLKYGFPVDGVVQKEVAYDQEEISGNLYVQAVNESSRSRGFNVNTNVQETDYLVHLYLGAAAIIAVNPTFSFPEIINNIKGPDIKKLVRIGRDFFNESEDASQSNSDEPTDLTVENSTLA